MGCRRRQRRRGADRRGQSDRWYFSTNLPRDHRADRAITGLPVSMSSLVSARTPCTSSPTIRRWGLQHPEPAKNYKDCAHNIVPNDLDLGVQARCKFSVLAA